MNGGDDETRTRDLCRDSNYKYLQQLTRLQGTAKYLIIRRSQVEFGLEFGLKTAALSYRGRQWCGRDMNPLAAMR